MLEDIEWTRMWREEVNAGKARVLLIGDSIIDGSKTLIGQALGARASITAFITSKAIDNPYYLRELGLLIEQENAGYGAVYFNNGLHTGGLSPEAYGACYARAVDFLREKIPAARLILGLSTPVAKGVTDPGKADAPITVMSGYADINETVRAFNTQVRAIADRKNLLVFDAYSCMDGHPEFRVPDGYHYKEDGYRYLADGIAGAIKTVL